MLIPKACPRCDVGDLLVEHTDGSATVTCQRCGYVTDPEAARRSMTLRALDLARQRERRRQAAT